MTKIKVEPHIVVKGTNIDPASDEFEGWHEYLDYHIAAVDEESNNLYVGGIIDNLVSYRDNNPEMWWKVEYYERRFLKTTGGKMALSGVRFDVTDINHAATDGMLREEFQDRNDDGHKEFNRALPVYEEFPRFLTEHDLAETNKDPDADTVDGEPVDKPKGEGAPGEEVEGEDEPDDTLHVSDGDVITVYDELGHEQQLRISVV